MHLFPLTLTLAMFSILYHWLKALDSRRDCIWPLMPWVSHPGAPSVGLPLRVLGSLLWCHPLFLVYMRVCSRCHHQWTVLDKVIWAATVVTALLLNIFHCSGKAHNELFGYTFSAIWVFAVMHSSLSVLSFSRCAIHAEGVMAGWLPLSFCIGKKLVAWACWYWLCDG